MLAFAVNWNDQADVLYGDEDFIDQNDERFAPYFKPDWNPDLFLSQNYIHNLLRHQAYDNNPGKAVWRCIERAYGV
jgi:hypothetical protein